MWTLVLAGLVVFSGSYGIPLESAEIRSRIHGGVDAPLGFAPHMAALLYKVFIVCGGSIISKRHILTAAHCITEFIEEDNRLSKSFHGRVGSNIWHSGGTVVQFEDHFVHPEWDEHTLKNDVGILLLTKQLVFNDKVTIIGIEFGWVGGNEKTYVTGWGRTLPRIEDDAVHLSPTPDRLQYLDLLTMTPEQCAAAINSTHSWAAIAPPLDPKVEMCTFHSFGHGMCHGDSGSALVVVSTGLQVGAVSWGIPCARGAPDFHTRLRGVEEFIRRVLGDLL